MFGIEHWTFSTLSDPRTHTPCPSTSHRMHFFEKKIALPNMVKIILYLCQFWTCATTLTSCCRRKIKSYCSNSATVYNSLQTRGHVTQRRITAYYCARMSGYSAARHWAGQKVAVIDRKRDLLSWSSSYFPHLNRGVALSSRQDEWRGGRSKHDPSSSHPRSGGGDTEDRGQRRGYQ